LQSDIKTILFSISLTAVVIALVLGSVAPVLAQTTPTSNLVKRDYSYANDQHLTARFGNDKVCGDHLCAPGEWTKLQENLNQAQIVHSPTNTTTKVVPVSSNATMTSTNTTMTGTNNTSQMQSPPVPPTPAPIPTPPSGPSTVCIGVKAVLENSTVPSTTVTRIMADLGCTS